MNGWTKKMLRVNLSEGSTSIEEIDEEILKDIKLLILEAHWIEWSDSVLSKAQLKAEIDTTKEISEQIRKLRKEKEELEFKNGIIFNRRTSDDDSRIIKLWFEIKELERKATENK